MPHHHHRHNHDDGDDNDDDDDDNHTNRERVRSGSIVVGNTTVVRGHDVAYTISSPSQRIIDSVYFLFNEYAHLSAPGKDRDANNALHHMHQSDIATWQLKLNFKMTKPVASAKRGGAYEIGIVGNMTETKQQYSVFCTTLREYMQDRTRAMSYDRALRMLELLRKQMTDLEVLNLSTPYYGLDDILVINDVFFCFVNDDKLFGYDADTNQMDVTRAISRAHAFYAPELLQPVNKINALPYSVDYRASYYSLGMLAAYCVLMKPELMSSASGPSLVGGGRKKKMAAADRRDAGARIVSSANIAALLHPIQYTKLYWFIIRCCNDDLARINSRMLIFV